MGVILRCKCALVGDATVGKTALLAALGGEPFSKAYSMTAGVDLKIQAVSVPDSDDLVELYVYDSAGQNVFTDTVPQYWENIAMVVAVYDVTDPKSFEHSSAWFEMARKKRKSGPLYGVVVANKTDLENRRRVSREEGESFAQQHDLTYFECSATDPQSVLPPFSHLAKDFHQSYVEKRQSLAVSE